MEQIKSPTFWTQINAIKGFKSDYITEVLKLHEDFGDSILLTVSKRRYILTKPDDLEVILKDTSGIVTKTPFFSQLKSLWGDGLFTSFGEAWKAQRRAISPLFTKKYIDELMSRVSQNSWDYIEENMSSNETADVVPHLVNLTLGNISELLLGLSVGEEVDEFRWAVDVIQKQSCKRYFSLFNAPMYVPTRDNLETKRAIEIIRGTTKRLMHESMNRDQSGFISHLKKNKHLTFSEEQIVDQLVNLLLAGHITLVNAMSWTLLLLCQNPEYQQKAFDEIESVTRGEPVSTKVIEDLPLVKAIIQEGMRFYPPLALFGRKINQDLELNRFTIQADSFASLAIFITHSDPEYWDEPNKFKPERFYDKNNIHKYAYLPFGAGPLRCVGEHMAISEMVLIMSQLMQNYRFELVGEAPKREPLVTVRPKGGLNLKWTQRAERASIKKTS